MRRRKLFGAFSIFAVLATVVVIGATSGSNPASAWVGPNNSLTTTVNLDCLATAPIVGDVRDHAGHHPHHQAPNKVESGETFDILAQSPSQVAPTHRSPATRSTTSRTSRFASRYRRAPHGWSAKRSCPRPASTTAAARPSRWDAVNSRYILKTSGNIAGGYDLPAPAGEAPPAGVGAPGSDRSSPRSAATASPTSASR